MIDDRMADSPPRRSRPDVVGVLREGLADRLPAALRPAVVSWRAAAVALVLAVMVGAVLVARAQTPGEGVSSAVPRRAVSSHGGTGPPVSWSPSGGGTPGPVAAVPGSGGVVVHVVGRVRRQGLVRLPAGSRVSDAVTAAGGPAAAARLDRLNLARLLTDGEQILVPGPNDAVPPVAAGAGGGGGGPGAVGGGGGGGAAGGPGVPVDLNAATAADLDALPGVGPVLAGRILAWRTEHGRFTRVAELGEVPGIGDKMLAQLTPLVRV